MALLEQWGVPLAVLGMLLATVSMASLVNRYQAHQARIRDVVRGLESGMLRAEGALALLKGVPLSRELRVTLRRDILARQRRIRRLYPRYPGMAERIRRAESALSGEGAPLPGGVGPIESEEVFCRIQRALGDLIAVMDHGDTLEPIPRDVRVIFRRELGERRAEVLARYHLVAAHRHETRGNLARARAHLTTLMQLLRRRGPSTPFVRELIAEADATLVKLATGQHEVAGVAGALAVSGR